MAKSKNSIYIATPCYNGDTRVNYTNSLVNLVEELMYRKIPNKRYLTGGEAMIPRARNSHAQSFLESDHTHLLFIDSDVGFTVENFNRVLKATERYPVAGAAYPAKDYNWNLLLQTGKMLDVMIRFFTPSEGAEIDSNGFLEVEHLPTGFMMITRECFNVLMEAYPDLHYMDHAPDTGELRKTWNFFDPLVNDDGFYLGEDYSFCHRVRKAGMKMVIDIEKSGTLTHQGAHVFGKFNGLNS